MEFFGFLFFKLQVTGYIYNICTLSVNIKFICTSFRNMQNSEPSASFSGLFRSEYKWILYLTTMYVFCVYPAMSKKSENLSDLDKKDRNKRHSSPFINVVNGVFFVVRVTLVPVSLFVNILLYVIVFGYVCLLNCLYIYIFFNCSLIDDRSLFGLYFNKNYLLTYLLVCALRCT